MPKPGPRILRRRSLAGYRRTASLDVEKAALHFWTVRKAASLVRLEVRALISIPLISIHGVGSSLTHQIKPSSGSDHLVPPHRAQSAVRSTNRRRRLRLESPTSPLICSAALQDLGPEVMSPWPGPYVFFFAAYRAYSLLRYEARYW